MSKYELYSELRDAHGRVIYVFIAESDDLDELLEHKKEVVCKYIIISNFHLAALIDGYPLLDEDFHSAEYRAMITECKIAKNVDKANINLESRDTLAKLDEFVAKGEKEAQEYFLRFNISPKAKRIPFNKTET